MPYEFYKILHLCAFQLIYIAIGGWVIHALQGGTKKTLKHRALLSTLHGAGLVLLLVAGFGMLAKAHLPWAPANWAGLKTWIWVGLGLFPLCIYRAPQLARLWLLLAIALGVLAGYAAIVKP